VFPKIVIFETALNSRRIVLNMKDSKLLLGFVILFFASFLIAGCLNEDNKIPENCYDGFLNNGEEFIDCGGVNCPLCDPCENFIWEPELGEQWVDCGGECDPCLSSYNGQLDPGEDGIDCGGDTGVDCGELCGDGLLNGNEEEIDCGGPDCDACPTCIDGEMNGDEIGIDCGGDDCPDCITDGDCTNGEIDGDELYVDCGGSTCPECEAFMTWKLNGMTFIANLDASAVMNGTSIDIVGQSNDPQLGNFGATLAEPTVGWIGGVAIICNPASMPNSLAIYTNNLGDVFASQFGVSSVTFTISYVVPGAGGFIVGTFSGQLRTATDELVNISNGSFQLPIN